MSSPAAVTAANSRPGARGPVCAIHQPHYLPWLRYFAKAAACDVFVLLDDVQFTKNGWQNRNKVKTATGWTFLTVPVIHKAGQLICEVKIDNRRKWAAKHARTIEMNYSKAPFFAEYWPRLASVYEREWQWLADLAGAQFQLLAECLGLEVDVRVSSDLETASAETARLVEICQAVGAGAYLSGSFAVEAYLQPEAFARAGLDLALADWQAPEYSQLYPQAGFIADLCVLDLLFNEGPASLEILRAASQIQVGESR